MHRFSLPAVAFAALVLTGCSADSKGQHDATLTPSTPAARQSDPVYSYVDAVRTDLSDGKVKIITHVMQLTPEESKIFWPIYHDYEEDLFALGDQRVELTRAFVRSQTDKSMDDQQARSLASNWFKLESDRLDLLKKYNDRISSELSPVRAAQFTQIEHRVGTVVDLLLASELPLIKNDRFSP